MAAYPTCVIFGGTGFIGSHVALFFADNGLAEDIVLVDIAPPRADFRFPECVRYVRADVRQPIDDPALPAHADIVFNFAAVHREPGHALHEYYETNLPGAENVCAWTERAGCDQLVFTSSIAPYGPCETPRSEASIPTPDSPYGGSKLAAEKIHQAWQRAAPGRRLVIVRPGVVFGPGEGGNVTRLIRATLRHYFCYMGNRQTRKAGGYVKELVRTMLWALERIPPQGGMLLYNFTMPQPPTVEEYVCTVCRVAGVRRFVPTLPYPLLLAAAHATEMIARPFGIRQPISPVRIRKLVRSTHIEPRVLREQGYVFHYDLEAAMRDWRQDRPDEWR